MGTSNAALAATADLWFSPSQIDTFMSCPRKWAFGSIARIKGTQAKSAQVGDAGHKQVERYLAGGDLDFTEVVHGINVGDVMSAGVHLLPEPCGPFEIESTFRFVSPVTGYGYTGRKDVSFSDSSIWPEFTLPGLPGTGDHKTTKALRWAKTPEDLEWDSQGVIYSFEALQAHPQAPAVDLFWVYYQTEGARRAERVHLRMLRDDAVERFGVVEQVAADMASVHAVIPALPREPAPTLDEQKATIARINDLVRPEPTHCSAYGGCPHQHLCTLDINERTFTMADSVLDSLRKRAEGAPVPSPLQKEAPPTPAASGIISSLRKAAVAAPPQINPPESKLPPEAPPAVAQAPADEFTVVRAQATVTRPFEEPAKSVLTEVDELTPEERAVCGLKPKSEAEVELATAIAADDAAKGKGRKGRPPGSKNKPKGEETAEAPEGPEVARKGFVGVLYIDCAPSDGYRDAVEFFALAKQDILDYQAGKGEPVADYRFVAGFGQAAGMLTAAFMRHVEEAKPRRVVINSRTDEARAVINSLAAASAVVVRAFE